ncbi:unnamed protein product [Adineta ricciae]|uniref:Metallo-beta-lactamase domain-containing protein n=2 Tax=Adineta ricciae TaxID=249248 RepID=A0A814UUP2_ADIRI|nr:unnamed protein product [Adineta ricciae]
MGGSTSIPNSISTNSEQCSKLVSDTQLPIMSGLSSYDVICLGVGKGATAVYFDQTSSSFALVRRSTGECILLIDMGLGSIFALQKYIKDFQIKPRQIFISHNHTDHSGELPVYIANEALKSLVRIVCYVGIQSRLRHQRCAELDSSTTDLFHNVQWITCDESQDVDLDSGDPNSKLKIRVHQSQHSELCAGFVLYENNQAILSFSGDSGFNVPFYTFLWTAPTILVDGRQTTTYEHASFDEILNFHKAKSIPRQVLVYHYGLESDKPKFPDGTISAISPGQTVQLTLPSDI